MRQLNLMAAFEPLEDPRRQKSCDYPLQDLLLTVVCAISASADDWVEVAAWGEEKLDWLNQNTATKKISKKCLRKMAAWNTKRLEDILGLHDLSAHAKSLVT